MKLPFNTKAMRLAIKELRNNNWYDTLKRTQDRDHLKYYIRKYGKSLQNIKDEKELVQIDPVHALVGIPIDLFDKIKKQRLEYKFEQLKRGYEANQEAIRTGMAPNTADLERIRAFI